MLETLNKKTLQNIIESSPIGLFLTDTSGHVTWYNPTLAHLLGNQQSTFTGQTEDSVQSDLKALFSDKGIVQIHSQDSPSKHFICTKQLLDAGVTIHFVHDASSMQQLFTEKEELQSIINEMKAIDTLTGMPNKQAILNALEPQVSRSRRYDNILSLIIVQLKNLETLRSQIGNEQANELIVACSHMLNDQVRWADMIGHIEDNEFLIILPETTELDTHKLKDILSERFATIQVGEMASKNLSVETDFGVAQWQKGMDVPLFINTAREFLDEVPQEEATA